MTHGISVIKLAKHLADLESMWPWKNLMPGEQDEYKVRAQELLNTIKSLEDDDWKYPPVCTQWIGHQDQHKATVRKRRCHCRGREGQFANGTGTHTEHIEASEGCWHSLPGIELGMVRAAAREIDPIAWVTHMPTDGEHRRAVSLIRAHDALRAARAWQRKTEYERGY